MHCENILYQLKEARFTRTASTVKKRALGPLFSPGGKEASLFLYGDSQGAVFFILLAAKRVGHTFRSSSARGFNRPCPVKCDDDHNRVILYYNEE